jgi:microcystin-dependent protein
MPNLTITKNYADGSTLTKAHLDSALDSVSTFLNSTKIDSTNIQSGGIAETNLASSAVVEAKIASGAVTTAKIADSAITTVKVADANVTRAKLESDLQYAFCPAGTMFAFGGSSAPTGFLLCDGSTVSRTTYAALFAVIGTNFGNGDGSTTFTLPDTRGYFLRGVDGSAGRDPDKASRTAAATGGNTGNNIGSVQDDAFESHLHTTNAVSYSGGLNSTASGGNYGFSVPENTGSTGGNETRPKNLYVQYIIKT